MKFEARTLQVMKNFATINPSLLFKPGNVLRTCSPSKTILGIATVPNTFDREFGIYDISRFMSTLSLFEEPEIELGDRSLTVRSKGASLNYMYASPSVIIAPKDGEVRLPSTDVQFTLTNETLASVSKAMGLLGLPGMAVVGDGETLKVQAVDSKEKVQDTFSIDVGETDKKFSIFFKAENLKILPMNYDVSISSKGIALFKGDQIEYWIMAESNSIRFE